MAENEHCLKHTFERAYNVCGQCGHSYCEDCLIQPFPRRPPLCKECAMSMAGIRTSAAVRPVRTKKEIKEMARQQAAAAPPKQSRRERAQPTVNPINFLNTPDAVPADLGGTKGPARTKRLWRAAG